MRSVVSAILVALALLAQIASWVVPSFALGEDEVKLSQEALLMLFPANIDAFSKRIGPSIYSLRGDGTFTYRLFAGQFDDKGTWRIEEGKLCLKFEFLGEGKELCQWVYQTEPGHYKITTQDQKEELTFTVWSDSNDATQLQE